jgi:Holliday junction resolvase
MSFKLFFDKTCALSKGEKGIEFEKYCKKYLEKNGYKKVSMYSEYVSKHPDTCLPKEDCGADLIIENTSGTIQIVQCKFRKDIKKKVSQKDIATTFAFAEKIKKCISFPIIIMTTSTSHASFFDDMKDVKFYHWDDFEVKKGISIFKKLANLFIEDAEAFNVELAKISNEGKSADLDIDACIKKVSKLREKYPNSSYNPALECWKNANGKRAIMYLDIYKHGALSGLQPDLFQYETKAFGKYIKK